MLEQKGIDPAAHSETSYGNFSDQIDAESGIRVGLVPLELAFQEKPVLSSIFEKAKIHDVGVGRAASTEYILSKVSPKIRSTLTVVASDPYPEGEDPTEILAEEVASHKFIKAFANEAVSQVKDCDLITMINMIHLVPEEQREKLPSLVFDSLKPGGIWIVSTTFIDEWAPNKEVFNFIAAWRFSVVKKVVKDKVIEVDKFRELLETNQLKTWSAREYINRISGAGFNIVFPDNLEVPVAELANVPLQTMPGTLEGYKLISYDKEWLDHAVPGVAYPLATQISHDSLEAVRKRHEWTNDHSLPRNTLVVIAQKPA